MWKWIKRFFTPQKNFICGGEGFIEFVDALGRVKSKIYFMRPDSDMRLNYAHEYQDKTANDKQLREIKADQDKGGNTSKKIYQIIIRDLFLPYAEKIFSRSEMYCDENRKPIDNWEKEKQFALIKKYYSHHLINMVTTAFGDDSTLKKN